MIQEDRISARQFRRMIFIETFGTGALSVPMIACHKGQSGFWALLFYGVFLFATTAFFAVFSAKVSEMPEKISDSINKEFPGNKMDTQKIDYIERCPQAVKIIYSIRFFMNAAALFYFFGWTMKTIYMPESELFFILFPAAALLWYSVHTTLQKRARFLELIFPWIIVICLLAIFLSFSGIEKTVSAGEGIWQGMFSDNIGQSIRNGYLLLLCSSPVEFLLFAGPAVKKASTLQQNTAMIKEIVNKIAMAVAGTFLGNVIFTFLAVRTLGRTITGQSVWPVVKMMQLVRMPGGFLERFDILPIVFWILCMTVVLSGYLYYGSYLSGSFFHSMRRMGTESERKSCGAIAGESPIVFLLLAGFVENHRILWTFYLKYKVFVDFPLSLLLPVILCLCGKENLEKKSAEKNGEEEKTAIKERKQVMKTKKIKQRKQIIKTKKIMSCLLIFPVLFPVIFSLTGCQRLTDVEEKNYILSMYVDYSSEKENVYEFWVAHADLSKMDERDEEIPCQVTKIRAGNLQELEEKYMETVPGKTEWNHIYTIFLGTGIAADKKACTRLLEEWDASWQKSPNVLLVLCPESAKKLYTVKNIPDGAAGQEVSLLAEQNTGQKKKYNKENFEKNICETPIDYLRAAERKPEKIALYRITIENGSLMMGRGVM